MFCTYNSPKIIYSNDETLAVQYLLTSSYTVLDVPLGNSFPLGRQTKFQTRT
jgi:hypothetical protein